MNRFGLHSPELGRALARARIEWERDGVLSLCTIFELSEAGVDVHALEEWLANNQEEN